MSAPADKHRPRTATYADIEALPAHQVGEIIFGALYANPHPTPRHATAASVINGELYNPFQRGTAGPGGWVFMSEPELHLDTHVLVPDFAGWRTERMPRVPDTAFVELPPDWMCEILSPSTARIDRTEKLEIYATFEIPFAWYVDPFARTLEVLALQNERYEIAQTYSIADEVTAPPFEAHTFPLNALWPLDDLGKAEGK
ncbi:MAG: Uma2 family endonuclease [Pseudomonadota bacterium]